MQSISSYINPNTRGLTSNYKNTAIKDRKKRELGLHIILRLREI